MKRQLLILILLLGLGLPLVAQTGSTTLVLWHRDGTTTEVALYTQPRVTFADGKVLVSSDVLSLEYAADDILRFTYKGSGTGISLPQTEADYSQEDGQIIFHGISSSDRVAVYTTSGIRVPVHLTVSGTSLSLPLADISSGVYILSVNGRTSKFTKR